MQNIRESEPPEGFAITLIWLRKTTKVLGLKEDQASVYKDKYHVRLRFLVTIYIFYSFILLV